MLTPNPNQPILPPTYTTADLQGGWEFKVLQSSGLAFRKRKVLQKVREEEALAGWVLVEKIDDGHLRFKRLASARVNDQNLSFDAYRAQYGTSISIRQFIFWALIVIGAVALCFLFTNRL
jgi:hypothetical protein